jgi:excisionase family DNA binding protein
VPEVWNESLQDRESVKMPKRKSTIIKNKTYYYTSEACAMAGISRGTLFRWIREGIIPEVKMKDRNGWRLFSEADIEKVKAEAQKTKNI